MWCYVLMTWIHLCCDKDNFDIFNDLALFLQHCAYCKRLGASIKCCAEGCAQLYHYPCAGAAGTFQDIRSFSLLCPEHHELATHKCMLEYIPEQNVCLKKKNTGEVTVQTDIWQCLSLIQLTVFLIFFLIVADDVNCTLCDSPGDLLDQLFCTSCGQHYHGICLDMAVTPLRRAGWQCPECKICQTCKWVSFPPT